MAWTNTLLGYRFRYDDGGEDANWMGPLDSTASTIPGQIVRLRILLYAIGDGSYIAPGTLQYRIGAGGWTNVAAGAAIRPQTSSYFSHGGATIKQMPLPWGGSWWPGRFLELSALWPEVIASRPFNTESEICLLVTTAISAGTVVTFRLPGATTASGKTPTLNVSGSIDKTIYPSTLTLTASHPAATCLIHGTATDFATGPSMSLFRYDNGDEINATPMIWPPWSRTQLAVVPGTTLRVRWKIICVNQSGQFVGTILPRLQYRTGLDEMLIDVSPWAALVNPQSSPWFNQGDPTTPLLSDSWIAFTPGAMDEAYGGITNPITIPAPNRTEIEFCVRINPNTLPGTVLRLRLADPVYNFYGPDAGQYDKLIYVVAAPVRIVYPNPLSLSVAVLPPYHDLTPSVSALTVAVPAPVPIVKRLPAVQTLTTATYAPTPKVTIAVAALSLTVANPTPEHGITQTDYTAFPDVLTLTANLQTPLRPQLPAVLGLTAALQTSVPTVIVKPATLALTVTWIGVGGWTKSPAVLPLTITVQTPAPKVIFVVSSPLTLSVAQPAPARVQRPAVLALEMELHAPNVFSFHTPEEDYYPRYAEED